MLADIFSKKNIKKKKNGFPTACMLFMSAFYGLLNFMLLFDMDLQTLVRTVF